MIPLRTACLAAGFALALSASVDLASAQPGGGPGMGQGGPMGRGMMMGPGRWSERGMRAYCNPQAAGFGAWRLEQIDRVVKPDEKQRKAFDDLRAASDKAAQSLSTACPKDVPKTMSERLAFMETRMTAMLDAVKAVRPAFDAFYATLSSEQKTRLDESRPHRWGWHRWRSYDR
jgi:LTXXQ motif family protein